MAKRKEPAIVWRDGDLIKILPVNSETIYFTDYSDEMFRLATGIRWRVMKGYLQGYVNKQVTMLHHLMLPKKDGYLCDHINRNKADNRKCNLRYVNRSESQVNRNMMSSNTSGYVGIKWIANRKRWMAAIRVNKKITYLGYFKEPEKAARAYLEAVEKYYPGILEEPQSVLN